MIFYAFLGYMILLSACTSPTIGPSEDYMIFDDVRYVKDFPIDITLSDAQDTGFDIIGLTSFQIIDSVLFASCNTKDGFWQFYSLEDGKLLGKMLNIGQGPNEFLMPIYDSNQYSIQKENDKLYAYIFSRGSVYRLDITETIVNEKLSMILLSQDLSKSILAFNTLNSNTFLCKEPIENRTKLNRYVQHNGEITIPEPLEKLNRAKISETDNLINMNILATSLRRQKDYVLETPIYLNYFNLYSLDGKLSLTICTDDKLQSISSILEKPNEERLYTFPGCKIFDKFFSVVSYKHTWQEWMNNIERKSQLQFFDWNGKPLANIDLNRFVSAFDIDFTNGYLYVLTQREDEFVKYDIKDFLTKLNAVLK